MSALQFHKHQPQQKPENVKLLDNLKFKRKAYFLKMENRWELPIHAAAESLQSCPTLCNPRDGSPLGSPVPGILQARTLEWVAISFSKVWKWKVKVNSVSRVRPLATPWTAAHQAPPLRPWDFPGKSTGVGCSRQITWPFVCDQFSL